MLQRAVVPPRTISNCHSPARHTTKKMIFFKSPPPASSVGEHRAAVQLELETPEFAGGAGGAERESVGVAGGLQGGGGVFVGEGGGEVGGALEVEVET